MIPEEEMMTGFLDSRRVQQSPELEALQIRALEADVPVIRPGTQRLIAFLMELTKPEAVLEVGTATGFSALWMHECRPQAEIVTIERDPARAAEAEENFRAMGDGAIRLLTGEAADILKELDGAYDFIFMDAGKGQYVHFLPDVKRLLKPGGILLSDNIFKEGEILKSRYAVSRRNRTIHRRMREYIDALTQDEELNTVLLETGDGAAITLKRERK